jgi:hypothetical protein
LLEPTLEDEMSGLKLAMILVLLTAAAPTLAREQKKPAQGPVFLNAEVVGIARDTVVMQSESGTTVITATRDAAPGLGELAMGDKVVVGYREMVEDGELKRIVLQVRPAAKLAPVKGTTTVVASGEGGTVTVLPSTAARTTTVEPGSEATLSGPLPSDASPAPPSATTTRAQALLEFEDALRGLQPLARQIDTAWGRYNGVCLPGYTPPADSRAWFVVRRGGIPVPDHDQCRQMLSEMEGLITELETGLNTAERKARMAEVPPGWLRDIRERNRLDL